MATISVTPTYPIPNRPIQLVFDTEHSDANFIRVWVTVAPTDSELDKNIKSDKDPRNRFEVYSGTGGVDFPFNTTLDKGGKYTFVIQEYQKGSGYGGSYQGDPNGSDLETKLGPEYTRYVYVGQRLTQPVGPTNLRATLNLYVWDQTILPTYKSVHGEDTPSITADPAVDLVKTAIESDSVKAALLALNNQSAAAVIGDLEYIVNDYFIVWNAHISDGEFHHNTDDLNWLNTSLKRSFTSSTLVDFVNACIFLNRLHFLDDNSQSKELEVTDNIGPGFGGFHVESDRPNLSIYQSVGGFDEAYGALVDLARSYESHRLAPGVHMEIDTANFLDNLPLLMQVHRAYLDIVSSPNPPAPPAQSTGAQALISGAGFKEI